MGGCRRSDCHVTIPKSRLWGRITRDHGNSASDQNSTDFRCDITKRGDAASFDVPAECPKAARWE